MDFGTEKKGYNAAEVDAFIERLRREYEGALTAQKQRISELKKQLIAAEAEVAAHKSKAGMVSQAIYNAVAKADEIERLSKIRYNQEIAQLKSFHNKWLDYYNKLLAKYPLDDDLIATANFNRQMNSILSRTEAEKQFKQESDRLGENIEHTAPLEALHEDLAEELTPKAFEPLDRIKMFFDENDANSKPEQVATEVKDEYKDRSASGFSFEEALHPKDDLSQIMRDLGILFDDN